MSPRHVLLALLLDRPAYPYQLADRMQQRLGPSWKVRSGPLYQAVKGLERDGFIERVNQSPATRDDRHVFAITQSGIQEFERWFDETPDTVRLSRPLLVKITFAGPDRLAQAMDRIDDYERECTERLATIAAMCEDLPDTKEGLVRADHLLLRLNLSSDVYALEGELRWAQNARELLISLPENGAVWPNGSSDENGKSSVAARAHLFTRIARGAGDLDVNDGQTPARESNSEPKRAAG